MRSAHKYVFFHSLLSAVLSFHTHILSHNPSISSLSSSTPSSSTCINNQSFSNILFKRYRCEKDSWILDALKDILKPNLWIATTAVPLPWVGDKIKFPWFYSLTGVKMTSTVKGEKEKFSLFDISRRHRRHRDYSKFSTFVGGFLNCYW